MHNFCTKYGKNRDIYKQMAKSFLGFVAASQTCASLSLRRQRDHESTRQRVAVALGYAFASQTTSLQVHKTTSGCRRCFAIASQTTSPRDYKTTSGCRLGLRWRYADEVALSRLRRLRVYKTTSRLPPHSLSR